MTNGWLTEKPGVVDEQVDRPVAVGEPCLDDRAGLGVREVGGQDLDVRAEPVREVVSRTPQAVVVPRHQHQVVAVLRQPFGVGEARGRPWHR